MKIRMVTLGMVFLSLIFVLTAASVVVGQMQTQGNVVKVVGAVVFLDGAAQPAYHVVDSSQINGVTTLSDLVNKSVSIVYYPDGNRNMIQTLQVVQ